MKTPRQGPDRPCPVTPRLLMLLAATSIPIQADILVQELFDAIAGPPPGTDSLLQGKGDTATSIGMTGTWTVNAGNSIFSASNFNVSGATLPGLPPSGGENGGLWNNTDGWDTAYYATRPLAAAIDFDTDQEVYFSVRLSNPGDTGMGIGFATGGTGSDEFVGAGFTWNNATSIGGPALDAGNASFISHGTLGADGGPYGIRVFDAKNSVNGYGLLVGRITISSTGDDLIQIKRYAENATIDNSLAAVVWSTSATFDSSMLASNLLLWLNGSGTGELDAIRVGETWTDVTGVTLAGEDQPALSGAGVASITGSSAEADVDLFTSAADVTLFWDTVDQGTGTWGNSNPLGAQAVGPVSGSITGLTPDTQYFYRFYAVNTTPEPDLDAWSEAGTSFATPPTGLAITDLDAETYSAFEIDLYWTDVFNTETGFIIQRSPAGAGTWTTVGSAPADSGSYFDVNSGLIPGTSYDYRVIATNGAGDSDPSNVASDTTFAAEPFETQLLIHFDGSLDGSVYTLGGGEIDTTGTFRASGAPVISGGIATLNPGAEGGLDGFDMDPLFLGDMTTQNWVAEVVITYQATGISADDPVIIDVQGDCNLRITDDTLQMFYWDGGTAHQSFPALPSSGVKVHLAYAWDATALTLTGYINGVAFETLSGGVFATPDASNISFGYFGRNGFDGRGVDGTLDAVAFQTGSAPFDPGTGFLILPENGTFADWIAGFDVGGLTGFEDDPDGDGLGNGVEAFLGTNPSVSNGSPLSQVSTDGTVTTFTHPQADPVPSDVTGGYQWSLDLLDWFAGDGIDGPVGGPTVSIPLVAPVGGTSTVNATSSEPLPAIFLRVQATN